MILLLNGASSVGKSSTAKAIQAISDLTFLHVEMDAFLNMAPTRLEGQIEGLRYEYINAVGDPPEVEIITGGFIQQTLRAMRRAIAALANEGLDLIIDEVMLDHETEADYRSLLERHDLRMIGLTASLAHIEAREAKRGDRLIGLARAQVRKVHEGRNYDLMVETNAASPQDIAERICSAFQLKK